MLSISVSIEFNWYYLRLSSSNVKERLDSIMLIKSGLFHRADKKVVDEMAASFSADDSAAVLRL